MSKEVVKGMIFLPGSWKDCIFFIKKKNASDILLLYGLLW